MAYLFNALFFLTPLVFYSMTSEVFEFNKMLVVYVITVIIVSWWAVDSVRARRIKFRRTVLDIPILIFLASALLSTFLSIDFRTSMLGYYSRFHGGFLSLLSYSLLYWAYVTYMDKFKTWVLLKMAIASAVIVSVYGILEHFGHSPSCLIIRGDFGVDCWVQDVQLRVFATMGQPNWMAAYLVALMPITWVGMLAGRGGGGKVGGGQVKKSWSGFVEFFSDTKNLLWGGCFGLMFLGLVFTKSRSGMIGFVVALVVFWSLVGWMRRKSVSDFIGSLLIFLVMIGLVAGTTFTPRMSELLRNNGEGEVVTNKGDSNVIVGGTVLTTGGTESGKIRQIVWGGAIDIWRRYPIFGTGLETFAYSYYQFRPLAHNGVSEWDFIYNKAHNEYLNILANSGLVGLGAYMTLIVFTLYLFASKFKISNNANLLKVNNDKLIIVALAAGYISILVTNFFGFSVVVIGMLFFLLPGMAASEQESKRVKEDKYSKFSAVQFLYILIILTATAFALNSIYNYFRADLSYAKARRLREVGNLTGAIESIEKGISLTPGEGLFHHELAKYYAALAKAAKKGDLEAAKGLSVLADNEISKAVSLNGSNFVVLQSEAKLYLDLATIDGLYIEKAKNSLNELVEFSPTHPKTYVSLGVLHIALEDLEAARMYLEKAVALKPDYKRARQLLGVVYEELGDEELAKSEYEYILDFIDPGDVNAKKSLEEDVVD